MPKDHELGLPNDFWQLPFHHKPLQPIDQSDTTGLLSLPATDKANLANARYGIGLINDSSYYECIPTPRHVPEARLLQSDFDLMLRDNYCAPHEGPVRGVVNIFTVGEKLNTPKARRRQITHPKAGNEAMPDSLLSVDYHVPKHVTRGRVKHGECCIQIDLAQAFSLYEFSDEVKSFHVFKFKGKLYHTTRVSMGGKVSSLVASVGTILIADVRRPEGVVIEVYCDGVRVTGPRDGVISAATDVLLRGHRIGCVWNEMSRSDIDGALGRGVQPDLSHLVTTAYDWCGEEYDHDHVTMRSPDRQVNKLAALWELRGDWTNRQWCGIIGLLQYMSSTQRLALFEHYPALRHVRTHAARMHLEGLGWDEPIGSLPEGVLNDLETWVRDALANKPVPIPTPPGRATWVGIGDASGSGFATLWWRVGTGQHHVVKGHWPRDYAAGMSVRDEPEGLVWGFVGNFPDGPSSEKVIYFTDHKGQTQANDAGFGKSYAYNHAIKRIHNRYPGMAVEQRWCAGLRMCSAADGWSRGKDITEVDKIEAMATMMELLDGDLNVKLSTRPFGSPYAPQGVATRDSAGIDVV